MKLRGNCPAKVDEKGRLKIPAVFLEALKEYGNQFYITSAPGEEKIFNENELLRADGGVGWAGKSAGARSAARIRADEGRSGRVRQPRLPRGHEPHPRARRPEEFAVHGRRR